MVRAISGVIFVLLFIVLLVFWMQNYSAFTTPVEIKFNIIFYRVEPLHLQVWALMLIMMAVGVLLTFFVQLAAWVNTRSKLIQANRKIRKMEKELTGLRGVEHSYSMQESSEKTE